MIRWLLPDRLSPLSYSSISSRAFSIGSRILMRLSRLRCSAGSLLHPISFTITSLGTSSGAHSGIATSSRQSSVCSSSLLSRCFLAPPGSSISLRARGLLQRVPLLGAPQPGREWRFHHRAASSRHPPDSEPSCGASHPSKEPGLLRLHELHKSAAGLDGVLAGYRVLCRFRFPSPSPARRLAPHPSHLLGNGNAGVLTNVGAV